MVFAVAAASFSLLLVLTGAAKVRRPHDTSRAIRSLGLPVPMQTGRLLGAVEIAIGLLALMTGAPQFLGLQALAYALFLAWVLLALLRDVPISSCGCLGRDDTPPYWGHVAINALAVVTSAGAAISADGLVFGASIGSGFALGFMIVVGAMLAWLILGDAARLHAAVKG